VGETKRRKGKVPDGSALRDWQQGDIALDIGGFVHMDTPDQGSETRFDPILDEDVRGVVIVSQTCDIVNNRSGKDFVAVCPLVVIEEESIPRVATGRTPIYAPIENAPGPQHVADLSRMMTVSKDLLITWRRRDGFLSDEARRKFAYALERKHGRFAFPDKFVDAIRAVLSRIRDKHKKDSEVGEIYRSLREIRARAAPSWNADLIELSLIIVLMDIEQQEIGRDKIKKEIDQQLDKVTLPDSFQWAAPRYEIGTLDDLRAREIYESHPLDLNYLSISNES